VDALVLCGGVVLLACSFAAWVTLSLAVVVGRLRYDRRSTAGPPTLSRRRAARLVRRAGRQPRTEWGRWRGIAALMQLARSRHPAAPRLIRAALASPDAKISGAAIRALGDIGGEWAIELLLESMRLGRGSRSRIATQLERLAPAPGARLVPLLRDPKPNVRFWGARLLGGYQDLGESALVVSSWDPNANVRAAVMETLGTRSGPAVETALQAGLHDNAWFVRAHAAPGAARVVGASAAPAIAGLLADHQWWVRAAAKDALRSLGTDAISALLATLGHDDRFAREGAAEVLQDIGFIDFLQLDDPRSPILERIYAAGGEPFRDAAIARIGSRLGAVRPEAA
jgi:HEAT repeat protein